MVEKSMDVKATLRDLAPRLKREYDRLLAPGKLGPDGHITASRAAGGGARRGLSLELLVAELSRRGLCKDVKLRPTAAVTGTVLPELRTHLSQHDVKGAFVTAQAAQDEQGAVDFNEFVLCLALCGHVKYEEVEGMTLKQRVAGIAANFLGDRDEQQVLTHALVPPIERFDCTRVEPPAGLEAEKHARFISCWQSIDLARVVGFPLWEKAVFHLLHRAFGDISSIFAAYAGRADAAHEGLASTHAVDTLPQSTLTSLALDCGLATEAFPMVCVQAVFQRAGQADDGKVGYRALELHEFLEAVVQLSFSRANPRFGEVGNEQLAPAHPLPDCFEQMLTQKLLQGAKRSGLAVVKEEMLADPEVLTLSKPQP